MGTSKQHKIMPHKVFNKSLKRLGRFYGILCVRSIRGFDKFSVDPYYEPLSRFMIHKVENIFSTVWLVLFSIQRVLCVLDSDKVS